MGTSPKGTAPNAAIAALRLFNTKAERLRGGSFARKAFLEKSGVRMRGGQEEPLSVSRHGPSMEEIEAAALTIRFFIQDNEPSSLRNMARRYRTLAVSEVLRNNFLDARTKLNVFLDSPMEPRFTYNGQVLSNREVFSVFMWGALAHSRRKEAYDKWASNYALIPLFENALVVVLIRFLEALFYMVSVNNAVLKELGQPPVPHAFPLKPAE